MAVEDAIPEVTDVRVLTERYLLDAWPWPLSVRLTVVRDGERGFLQRDRFGVPEPIVYGSGTTRCRRYACLRDVVRYGWRAL